MNNWRITNDFMMIVGKYFESSIDYINVMKVNKKYSQLVSMYKFNPIGDISLFENIQTQHFYTLKDFDNIRPMMFRYIYHGKFKKSMYAMVREANDNKLKYKVNKYDDTLKITDKCISISRDQKHIITLLNSPVSLSQLVRNNIYVDKLLYNSDASTQFPKLEGLVIHILYDDNNNSMAILKNYSYVDSVSRLKIPSIASISYYDYNGKSMLLDQSMATISSSNSDVKVTLNNNSVLSFKYCTTRSNRTYINVENIGLSYDEFQSYVFPYSITSTVNPNLSRSLVKKHVVYKVATDFDSDYYNRLISSLYGKPFLVIADTWINSFLSPDYNFGYIRYIYIDKDMNSIMFNILPTEIIITTSIGKKITNYKPLTTMQNLINTFNDGNNVYVRYNLFELELYNYYEKDYYEMIKPLDTFTPVRLLLATNQLTRCSSVINGRYFIKVIGSQIISY